MRDDDDDVLRCQKHVVSSVSSREKKHLFLPPTRRYLPCSTPWTSRIAKQISTRRQLDTVRDVMNAFPRQKRRRRRRRRRRRKQQPPRKAAKTKSTRSRRSCASEKEKYARAIARELDDIRRRDDATSTTTMMMMMDDDRRLTSTRRRTKIVACSARRRRRRAKKNTTTTKIRRIIVRRKDGRTMTRGRVYSKTFLEKTKRLYDMHMGAENMGPVLYSFCRFTKPENVLEIGAGYTSVFLLQAMRDNKEEIATYERMRKENSCR